MFALDQILGNGFVLASIAGLLVWLFRDDFDPPAP